MNEVSFLKIDTTGYDPEFGGTIVADPGGRRGRSATAVVFRWLVVYPVAAFVGLNVVLWLLVVIKPFWTSDRLNEPVAVKGVSGNALLLADGRRVPLRFLKLAPGEDRVFREALKSGVEVDGRGEAYGLLTVYPSCGTTPCAYHVARVNLSELAAVLDAGCVDESVVPAEAIESRRELIDPRSIGPPDNPRRVKDHILRELMLWRLAFEASVRVRDGGGAHGAGEQGING